MPSRPEPTFLRPRCGSRTRHARAARSGTRRTGAEQTTPQSALSIRCYQHNDPGPRRGFALSAVTAHHVERRSSYVDGRVPGLRNRPATATYESACSRQIHWMIHRRTAHMLATVDDPANDDPLLDMIESVARDVLERIGDDSDLRFASSGSSSRWRRRRFKLPRPNSIRGGTRRCTEFFDPFATDARTARSPGLSIKKGPSGLVPYRVPTPARAR